MSVSRKHLLELRWNKDILRELIASEPASKELQRDSSDRRKIIGDWNIRNEERTTEMLSIWVNIINYFLESLKYISHDWKEKIFKDCPMGFSMY